MKTKLLFTLILLALFTEKSTSQTYIPMLNNTSWNLEIASFGWSQNVVMTTGPNVVIGAYTYKQIFDPTTNSNEYLREDAATKKVYRNVGGVDKLLYDFSLQVSNTITLSNGSIYTVASITNVNVNGGTRRRFQLDNGFFSETWIEGVGSNRHPLKPSYELFSDPYIYLTCSAQNGVMIYNHGIANGQPTPTDCSMLSVADMDYFKKEISFSPNPFQTELSITRKSNFENSTLKIFNAVGQLVKEVNNINGQKINIKRESLNSGLYFAQLTENGTVISTNKIIIAD